MVKLTVLYPRQEGGTFDMQYYLDTHMPLCRRLLGPALKNVAVDEGLAGTELPAPYVAVCHLTFESQESMQAVLLEHQAELGADIPNYTNVQPVFQASRVAIP
jgi:uncharacterized protein (TIGR02118 family)